MYKILGSDQKEYNAANADEIRSWIKTGRVAPQTQAQAEGGTAWKPLSEFPEFQNDFAAMRSTPGAGPAQSPPTIPGTAPPGGQGSGSSTSNGVAIVSLVLGILGVLGCMFLTGIPAVITGHIAHNRSRKDPSTYGGGGLAIAGLVMGYVAIAFSLLLIPIMAGLLLPALAQAKSKAQTINCVSNMKQIGLAARMWSNDHKEIFPPDIFSLSNELSSPAPLACPGDSSVVKALTWDGISSKNVSYEYLTPGIVEQDAYELEVFRCPIHNNIGYGDGSVQHKGGRRATPTRR